MSMKKKTNRRRIKLPRLLVFAITFILAGCGGSGSPSPPQETFLFKPPTAAATLTPTLNTQPTVTPMQTEECSNRLEFKKDITIPDGTSVEPGQSIVKQWLVTNAGSCNWDENYAVKLVSGPDLGAPRTQTLYPARNGQQVILQMNFTAPQDPGQYTSTWQAFDPQGNRFGDPFFIDIQVEEE